MGRRNLGSTRAARGLGWGLVVVGAALALCALFGFHFSWRFWQRPIQFGACVISGGVLLWWAKSYKLESHIKDSGRKIGHVTVEMTVGVLAAVVAVFALVDAAAFNEEQREKAQADSVALATAVEKLEAATRALAAQRAAPTDLSPTETSAQTANTSPDSERDPKQRGQ